ncbi:unnamed protein product [Cylindrotheca closterium]|uniref:Uncharacterized protein n=1 Tax=Cylindrotheca closterium TaxID=2856 RepID=A0AAD2FV35_9STRA|nr:unnamed protein product [Cylindrotheca closterium]
MWSPVAAIKKSFRKSGDDANLPPPALLNDEDLADANANSNSNNRSTAEMWSPVAALKRSFRIRASNQQQDSTTTSTTAGLPPPALLDEEDLQDDEDANNNNDGIHSNADESSSNDHHQQQQRTNSSHNDNDNSNGGNLEHKDNPDDSNSSNYDEHPNIDIPENDETAPPSPGFNTRLSGFNTRLLADDDLGDVDNEENDNDDDLDDVEEYQDARQEEEFDFSGQDDDDLIARAFAGVDVSDNEEYGEEYFNEWYLMDDEEGFLAPILFEDGMNSDECDLYYITLEEDKLLMQDIDGPSPISTLARRSLPTQFRSALPLRPLEEEESDELPSCLREPKKRPVENELVPLRRRSFGGLPTLQELPEFYRAHSCPDLSNLHSPQFKPKVNFDTEVQVVSVFAASDYPRRIRSNLWLTRKEIRSIRKEASYERRKERRQREKDYAAGRGTF